jgi:probable HAF family extracellular repeat protein
MIPGTSTTRFAMIVISALAISADLAAQDQPGPEQNAQHHQYKLIEIGTFGGPNSYFTFISKTQNKRGAATGFADTSTGLTPPFCLVDCFATHAFEWRDGVVADLGALPGIGASFPNGINANGVLAGLSLNGGFDPALGLPYFDAVVFKDGQVIDLGTFGGPLSYSAAINDRAQVVGFALNSTPDSFDLGDSCENFPMPTQMRAFVWQDGVKRDIGTLGGTDSCALFINNRGQAVGVSFTNSAVNPSTGVPTIHPFLWNGDEMVDLGSLGGTLAFANGINNRGQVAGASTLAGDQTFDAYIWDKGQLTDLGNLGGSRLEVIGFNEVGELVGKALLPDESTIHAFVAKNGKMIDLGSHADNPCSYAIQINSREQIVGFSDDCGGNHSRALLWENGRIVNLNSLVRRSGLTLTAGVSINDRGEITAQGVLANGDQRAVLLIPCDEEHPSVDGCDYGMMDGAAQLPVARATMRPASIHISAPALWRRNYRFHMPALGSRN